MSSAISYYPDRVLLSRASPVSDFGSSLDAIIADMNEAMYRANGIGLAAPQIGVPLRIFVMDLSESRNAPEVFINPELEVVGDEQVMAHEGCLSLPGAGCSVPRFKKVRLTAVNRDGKEVQVTAEGLKSACFQHECDHLNGKLYIAHLSSAKRQKMVGDFKKFIKKNKSS